jgi:O-antigen/teichoic acid export membrane protein
VALFLGFLLFIISAYFIPFVYGMNFSPSVLVLRILLPGVIVMTAFKVLNMDLASKGKPIVSLIAFIPALILNIILNIMWIPLFGINGSALASTVSYIFGALLFLSLYSRVLQIPIREIMMFQLRDFDSLKEYILSKIR